MKTKFIEKYETARKVKDSILCIGIDPSREILKSKNYEIKDEDDLIQTIIDFSYRIIEETSDYPCAYKWNRQHILPLSLKDSKNLNKKAHKEGCITIVDHKLSDISSTNREAIINIYEESFDAFTFSPFPGNSTLEKAVKQAHELGLGVIVLNLMSNLDAETTMKAKVIDEKMRETKPLYEIFASWIKEYDADGAVIGAPKLPITKEDVRTIREIIGSEKVILSPGYGAQGGGGKEIEMILKYGGEKILINVGRDIYSNPNEKAKEWYERINSIRKIFF
jgi:orotidine-5'-phosphate decarboxylase